MTSYYRKFNPDIPKSGKKVEDFTELCMISVILSQKSKNYSFSQNIKKLPSESFDFIVFSNISSWQLCRVKGMWGKWVLVKWVKNSYLSDFHMKNQPISKLSFLETYL